jgi:uncharacterized membrane protein
LVNYPLHSDKDPDGSQNKKPAEPPKSTRIIQQVTQESLAFSGPLPHPTVLEGYEKTLPGAAERVIKMAENQAAHRQGIEKVVINSDSRNATLGVIFAFIIAMTGLVFAYRLVMAGHGAEGTVIGALDLGALVGIFVYGTNVRAAERQGRLISKKISKD